MSQELPFQEWTSTNPKNGMVTTNKQESTKLLDFSDSDSESEALQFAPPKRKVRFKKRFRPGVKPKPPPVHSSPCCPCVPVLKGLAVLLIAIISLLQIWFVLNIRTRVDTLYTYYRNNVDSENKHLPETLHTIHSSLKEFEKNLTSVALELKKATNDIAALSKEVEQLKQTSTSLRDSIAAAPQIKELPKSVDDLKKNVATLGSKVTSLESNVKELGEQHSTIHTLQQDVETVKVSLQEVLNSTHTLAQNQKIASSGPSVDMVHLNTLEQQMLHTTADINRTLHHRLDEIEEYYFTVNASVSFILNDLHHYKLDIADLRSYVHEKLENGTTQLNKADVEDLINQTVKYVLNNSSSVANMTWEQLVRGVHQVILLYSSIKKELNITANSSKEYEAISKGIQVLINKTAASSVKIEDISADIKTLFNLYSKLPNTHPDSKAVPAGEVRQPKNNATNGDANSHQENVAGANSSKTLQSLMEGSRK